MHKTIQKIIDITLAGSMIVSLTPTFALEESDSLNKDVQLIDTQLTELSESKEIVKGNITVRYINALTDKVVFENVIENIDVGTTEVVNGADNLPDNYILDEESSDSQSIEITNENLTPVVEFRCYEKETKITMEFTKDSYLQSNDEGKIDIGVSSDELEFSENTIKNILDEHKSGFSVSNSNILDYEKEISDLLEEESSNLVAKRKIAIPETNNLLKDSCKVTIKVPKNELSELTSAYVYRCGDDGKIYYLGAGDINIDNSVYKISFNSSKLGNFFITYEELDSEGIIPEEESNMGTINVKYINNVTGKEIKTSKTISDVEFGKETYVTYENIQGYSLVDESLNTITVTLTKEEPSKDVCFYYNETEKKYVANVTEDTYKENEDKLGIKLYMGGSKIILYKDTVDKMKKIAPTGFEVSVSNILNNEKVVSDIIDNESVELLYKKRVEISEFNNSLIDKSMLEFGVDEELIENNSEFHVYRIGDDDVVYYLGDASLDDTASTPELEFEAKDLGDFFITNGLLENADIEIDEVVNIEDTETDNNEEVDNEENKDEDKDKGGDKKDESEKTDKLPDTSGIEATALGTSSMLTMLGSSILFKKKRR